MEGSESEAIFNSLNLNPQLFVNQVLNSVDDFVDEAFDYFYQEASTKLNTEGTKSQDLRKGAAFIQNRVQSVLDERLAVWEKYALYHCFAVPQGFHMPNSDVSSENGLHQDAPFDPEVDAQLDFWRKKLAEVGKESEMLNQELQELEKQSTLNAGFINEAVQLYEQNTAHELFQEIVKTASQLGMKMRKLNTSMIEESEQMKTKKIYSAELDLSVINPAEGPLNVKLDDLQDFLSIIKKSART